MDKKVQKLKNLLSRYLGKSRDEILSSLGKPPDQSAYEIWFYKDPKFGLFRDENVFIFKEDRVVDIMITEYFLWKPVKNIFYYEGESPQFKIVKLF